MQFYRVGYHQRNTSQDKYPCVILWSDSWNDYGYLTTYYVRFCRSREDLVELGGVKTLEAKNKREAKASTSIAAEFEELESRYCSLGQTEAYYRELKELGEVGVNILEGLKDVVYNENIHEQFSRMLGYKTSLLRFSEAA